MKLHNTIDGKEKAILAIIDNKRDMEYDFEGEVNECVNLAESAGVNVVEKIKCVIDTPNAGLYIGKGKAEEISIASGSLNADVVIFSENLSPSQQRNLEEVINTKTIDRTQLILDIFAKRAITNEGKIEIELAQLLYMLPRLAGQGIYLSRLGGGVGTRGPGEQKLEVDRRRVKERISRLKKTLKDITKTRELRRANRGNFSVLNIALVGYTNSGKSTLFNALTDSHVLEKDQLFSTLDPKVKKFVLSNNQSVVISDTVGFIRNLPHNLVESFKATLEEVVNADVLFNVIDISSKRMEIEANAVLDVLDEIGVKGKPVVTILNKMDIIEDENERRRIINKFYEPIMISALNRDNITAILARLTALLSKDMEKIEIVVPHSNFAAVKLIRDKGKIHEEKYTDEGVSIKGLIPRRFKPVLLKLLK